MSSQHQRGFGVVEVLTIGTVVAVVSVAAAVMATQFMDTGRSEAGGAALHNIQIAVIMLMSDNDIKRIPSPMLTPTRDMSAFPDGTTLRPPGLSGYRLYGHDTDSDGRADYDYVNQRTTKWLYVVDEYGLVKHARIVEEEPIQGLGALLQGAPGTPQ